MNLYYNVIYTIEYIEGENKGFIFKGILIQEDKNTLQLQDILADQMFVISKKRFNEECKIVGQELLSYPIFIPNSTYTTTIL
jgi:hypothetical protein